MMNWSSVWRGRSYDLGRMGLSDLVKAYFTYPTIILYIVLAIASAAVALAEATALAPVLGGVAAAVVIYPLAWYLLHRYILHGRWLYRSAATAALWKRIHFDHHQDPHKLEVLFGAPWNTVPTIAVITVPAGWAIGGLPAAAAAFCAGLVTTCIYEFCHCIQHLNFKPRNAYLKRIKQLHLIHHFHNENANYGIISFLPDSLFGTRYDGVRNLPRSPHVFNLGYDLEEAKRYPWVMKLTGSPPRDRPASAREGRAEALS